MKHLFTLTWLALSAVVLLSCARQSSLQPISAIPSPVNPETRASSEDKWEAIVLGAKKEGKVIIYSIWGPDTRMLLSKAFKDKYGIDVEWTAFSRGPELTARVSMENKSGLYLADAYGVGLTTILVTMKPLGLLRSIEPFLILPEVTDSKVWHLGKVPLVDKDKQGLGMIAAVQRYILRNTELVGAGEINSYQDLLKPQYKGKLLLNDPTVTGPGNAMIGHFAQDLWGEEGTVQFLKDLLIKQEALVVRDNRLQVEWVARGKYSIAIAPLIEAVQDFRRLGAPVALVLVKEGAPIVSGAGALALASTVPHPNATTLFVNWLLTREGQTVFIKGFGNPSARADVSGEGLDPLLFAQSGEKIYPESEEVIAIWRSKMMQVSKGIIDAVPK